MSTGQHKAWELEQERRPSTANKRRHMWGKALRECREHLHQADLSLRAAMRAVPKEATAIAEDQRRFQQQLFDLMAIFDGRVATDNMRAEQYGLRTTSTPKQERAYNCHADRDGECNWAPCPQVRDDEPHTTGRNCPLPHWTDDEE